MELTLNGRTLEAGSIEQLGVALDDIDAEPAFELWIGVPFGPSLCMLRNGADAWLTYLREPGDSGFRSRGDPSRSGLRAFTLANGQADEFPLAWCIDVERCYKAVASFHVNDGGRPGGIDWVAC